MTARDVAHDQEQTTGGLFAGLAGRLEGVTDRRAPLILLHGLSFDRTMWRPALAELRAIDPGRRVLAVDLPGHGESPAWPSYDLEGVADGMHRAAEEAGLRSPVVVGHSMAAAVATVYAARYPARGVVNVDQWLQIEPVARSIRSLAGLIRGPGFPAAWNVFETSMHIELLPSTAQELLRSGRNLRQDLIAGYWRELLDRPVTELAENTAAWLSALREAKVPYLFIAGHEVEPGYQDWLNDVLPQACVMVWPAAPGDRGLRRAARIHPRPRGRRATGIPSAERERTRPARAVRRAGDGAAGSVRPRASARAAGRRPDPGVLRRRRRGRAGAGAPAGRGPARPRPDQADYLPGDPAADRRA